MNPIIVFFIFFIVGLFIGIFIWKIYRIRNEREKQAQKEQLENEIVSSLLELKKHTTLDVSTELDTGYGELSNKYDLIEIALENEVVSITIANDEGLPVISTLKDPCEESAEYSALFQSISKSSKNKPSKISIEYDEKHYLYIKPVVKNDIKLFIIIRSNIELDPTSERKLIREILNVLDEYFPLNS
ncbi:hypothetical protein KKP91_02240 [Methanothermococcus sp. SCGC AD-155-M21]|nr:hypothetical protein [Methanothermococcus sp. SCGC AD-155-M21]